MLLKIILILMKCQKKVLILYLANSMLDSEVIAWSFHYGTRKKLHMPGDSDSDSDSDTKYWLTRLENDFQ